MAGRRATTKASLFCNSHTWMKWKKNEWTKATTKNKYFAHVQKNSDGKKIDWREQRGREREGETVIVVRDAGLQQAQHKLFKTKTYRINLGWQRINGTRWNETIYPVNLYAHFSCAHNWSAILTLFRCGYFFFDRNKN